MKSSISFIFVACIISIWSCTNHSDEYVSEEPQIHSFGNHFGIPYFNLSEDVDRHFILDREEGVYFGHPTTVKIEEDGKETALAVYPLGAHAKGITTLRKSVDGGRTWSERIPGASALGRIEEVPTIHKVVDPKGVERLIIFTGLYPARMTVSEDKGTTWLPFKAVGNWGGIVTMGDVIPLKENPEDGNYILGKYMALFHDDGRFIKEGGTVYRHPRKFILYKTLSNDGGLSWSPPEPIREDTTHMICEPGVVRSPDGTQLAMLLRENSRVYNSQIMFSNDEGISWTDPVDLPPALTGDRHVVRYNVDGRIVVAFRDVQRRTAKGPTEGDYVVWIGTYDDLVTGAKGQYRVRLLKNYQAYDCGYSGLELLEDGTFLAVTYLQYRIEDNGNNSVVSVRFALDELDLMAETIKERNN